MNWWTNELVSHIPQLTNSRILQFYFGAGGVAGARSLRAGNSFLIFPEGTRSKTDEMLPFKKGGFIMAIKAAAPIVPVAIQGGRAAMRRGSRVIRPVTVSIRVGTPIETAGLTLDDRDGLILRVRDAIASLLAEGPIADT